MGVMRVEAGARPGTVAAIVDALGTDAFEDETLRFLNVTSGVDHFTVYRLRAGRPEVLGGASVRGVNAAVRPRDARLGAQRSYADLQAARSAAAEANAPLVIQDKLDDLEEALRFAFDRFHIVDRVMVCGRRLDDLYAISLLRSAETGSFAPDAIQRLSQAAEVLVAACAKHAAIHWDRAKSVQGFDSVEFIEGKLRESGWRLSHRELQVAARILYGISVAGIALDLGLGEETIATYRKRLYQRLQIGGRHELFHRYLGLI
jgi:DNA-binding CsgD family transcriptional regulator